jgi:hypothetical protein
MTQIPRRLSLALLVAAAFALSSCGGGGGSASSGGSPPACSNPAGLTASFPTPTGINVVPLVVDAGPTVNGSPVGLTDQSYVTVKICVHGSTTACQTIDHVWVDTGSTGLRLFSSTFTSTLPASTDSIGNPIANCGQFLATYSWGAVRSADISIGGLSAVSVPIQVIGDSTVPATAPSSCSSFSGGALTATNTPTDQGANGLLGIGIFQQDCGPGCATIGQDGFYYTCPGGTCTAAPVATAAQLQNFAGQITTLDNGVLDNNGVLMQIPEVPPQGEASVSGWLIFGINTQSNNQLGSAKVYEIAATGQFAGFINTTTTYGSTSNPSSFIDSGSNGWFFNDPSLTACTGSAMGFFCSTAMLSATMGTAPASFTYSFCVADFKTLGAGSVFPDIGGPGTAGSFDWGLPFFYGRTVFTALEGTSIAGNTGPFYAASTP